MKSKSRLGRGIDAIFADSVQEDGAQVIEIPVDEIYPNPIQPRKSFDEKSIAELAASIKSHGLISPILVRRMNTRYEIIAGERRYQACKLAGIQKIPSIVRDIPDAEAFKISLIENLQREDLNPMEESEAYYTLKEQFGLTHQEIADAVLKDRSTVTNSMRLVHLPEEVKQALREGKITTGHARAILMVESLAGQISLLNRIVSQSLSVREAERYASGLDNKEKKKGVKKTDPYFDHLSSLLSEKLSAKVICDWRKRRGKIVINITSRDELSRIVAAICEQEVPI
ncbi:MAG: ParB/RepB/Spo0J family partition protein [Desulfomonilia bacterium]|jgi:ParB family chromosome partitioning protein|uniref:Chromosome-partitioning protein Spo0J n=1 Tax=anaerobic digester metagenome TaxID=1263854 RepID=A0A485M023_9ZZZZ|nr:ParB/RepB/Spo0J family partition protein [Pseudomonadota bacterium]HPD20228.1 ParB/RepB/Spo0J family partition protein [Deltaproteobacteria bacterium]HPX19249.1 ParB/RepB/Spo0J family partition protein [Deltaproteobacteria bacterium]HRS57094.1 ParB/RepB/Spo0J family partition protein [Desulfomonilia bacterium]HRV34945.1 ParB/RepB/Spo0J family partition protein [Desulfomonilia bacterium]